MDDIGSGEMSDVEIWQRYGPLIEEASVAFAVDSTYATSIVTKARAKLPKEDAGPVTIR